MSRYKIQRTGAPSGLGYGRGWIAMNERTGTGAWFPTWRRALNWVNRELLVEEIRQMQSVSHLAVGGGAKA